MRSLSPAVMTAILAHLRGAPAKLGREYLIEALERVLTERPVNTERQERRRRFVADLDAVRDEVKERSKFWHDDILCCEKCHVVAAGSGSMDHFFGGASRRSLQTPQTCWWLCVTCHRAKTENAPSAEHWLIKFRHHCITHKYFETVALIDAKLARVQAKKEMAHG